MCIKRGPGSAWSHRRRRFLRRLDRQGRLGWKPFLVGIPSGDSTSQSNVHTQLAHFRVVKATHLRCAPFRVCTFQIKSCLLADRARARAQVCGCEGEEKRQTFSRISPRKNRQFSRRFSWVLALYVTANRVSTFQALLAIITGKNFDIEKEALHQAGKVVGATFAAFFQLFWSRGTSVSGNVTLSLFCFEQSPTIFCVDYFPILENVRGARGKVAELEIFRRWGIHAGCGAPFLPLSTMSFMTWWLWFWINDPPEPSIDHRSRCHASLVAIIRRTTAETRIYQRNRVFANAHFPLARGSAHI